MNTIDFLKLYDDWFDKGRQYANLEEYSIPECMYQWYCNKPNHKTTNRQEVALFYHAYNRAVASDSAKQLSCFPREVLRCYIIGYIAQIMES